MRSEREKSYSERSVSLKYCGVFPYPIFNSYQKSACLQDIVAILIELHVKSYRIVRATAETMILRIVAPRVDYLLALWAKILTFGRISKFTLLSLNRIIHFCFSKLMVQSYENIWILPHFLVTLQSKMKLLCHVRQTE